MISGSATLCLDGDFGYPTEKFSVRGEGGWWVVSRGPKYVNQFKVTAHDAAGLAWLEANVRPSDEVGKEDGHA